MEIIPAIDIIDGECVRLIQGDYNYKTTYSKDPLSVAKQFEDAGIKRLHLVDLDGAKQKHVVNIDVLRRISNNTDLIIDFGGGVKSNDDIEKVFAAGANMVTGGSIAVKNPQTFERWLRDYGADTIILGADVKDRRIAIEGWMETSDTDIFDFIEYYKKKSIKFVICTDISRDGVLSGPSIDLYQEILRKFPDLKLIASGGVSSIQDLEKLVDTGVWGTIIGKAIYEKKISLPDLKLFLD